jgi:hypothetical protein
VRPDAEGEDLNRKNVECQFDASKLTTSAGLDGMATERKRAELEALCMEANGCHGGDPGLTYRAGVVDQALRFAWE